MKKELEIFSTRYSCRNFKNEKLKKEDLNSIIRNSKIKPKLLGTGTLEIYSSAR